MSSVSIARWQFGITTVYHFFFVPLTIGLSLIVAIMETLYVITKNEKYKKATKFWGNLLLINFAIGIVTGLIQEFQFGMNWSIFSRFVGDIFGVPLALEALLAFFLESTFLGVWIFGRDKVNKVVHLLSIWIVAISSLLSAFFILAANSFMQYPVGYSLKDGHLVMSSFKAIIANPHLWVQFPHTIFAALCTAGFFVLGISAYHLLKKNNEEWVKISLKIGLVVSTISTVLVIGFGDLQGKFDARYLPMKLAASEALWDSQAPAPFSAIAIIDQSNDKNIFEIDIPDLLSFLSYSNFHAKVEGINQIQKQYETEYGPGNYIPPVGVSFYTFRIMVGAGMAMLALAFITIVYHIKNIIFAKKLLLKLLVLAIGLPFIANTSGWILTEVTRNPWIVFGLFKTANSASPNVSSGYILTSLVVYIILYLIILFIDVKLMVKFIKSPLAEKDIVTNDKEESLWI